MQRTRRRDTVDLSAYPDMVMILLGLRLHGLRAIPALMGVGRGLATLRGDPPEGLLHSEQFLFGWNHVGIRQYWRDFASMERFTRAEPHAGWWSGFMKDPRGCGFWHETYSARGGIEAIYVDMPKRPGLGHFAPPREPVGPFLSGRGRLDDDAACRAKRVGS